MKCRLKVKCSVSQVLPSDAEQKLLAPFTKPIWSRPNPYRTTVQTKFGYVNGTFRYQIFGPDLSPDPKRDLLMCKDHGPIEFGPVPNLDM